MPIIGIDLGTTNSLAAVWQEGTVRLIPNALDSHLTPSAVSVDEDGAILVGRAAKDRLVSHPDRTAASFKRFMGTDKSFSLGGNPFVAEELSALVLRRLREDAEAYLGEAVTEAVISVPAYFGEAQRAATKRAGFLAGLTVERLVNEPSAAALASCLRGRSGDGSYLIFDMGGGTLDVSVVECFDNVVSVVAVCGDNHLGGDDFDQAIAARFCLENHIDQEDLAPIQQASLLRLAEQCKQALGRQKSAVLTLVGEDISGSMLLTREKLVEVTAQAFLRLAQPLRRVVQDSGIKLAELRGVVLVGGACHMPVIRQYLAQLLGLPILEPGDPETVVALGAGAYAGMKERRPGIREMVLTDICPFTLGTGIINSGNPDRPLMSPVIERNSVLPSSKVRRYCTAWDGQTRLDIQVYQGEDPYIKDNTELGVVSIPVPAAPAGQEVVDVRFTYDINGLLEVDVASVSTLVTRHQVLLGPGGMDQDQVEARLRALSALKIHPRDQSVNRAVMAQGERLFRETLGPRRDEVLRVLEEFHAALETQERWRIDRARKQTKRLFDQVEEEWARLGIYGEEPG